MSNVEENLKQILSGNAVPVSLIEEPQDSYKPLVKRTVTYIVAGLVFREDGKFVLVQEAKSSCYGAWYLPAGRVEPNENLLDAVKREVKEEAGLEFEPTSLLSVEGGGHYWYRFTYIGRAVGGHLKTLAEKDKESLQANWFTMKDIKHGALQIRARDMIKALKMGEEYLQRRPEDRHPILSVTVQPHHHLIHRPVIVRQTGMSGLEVLTYKGGLQSGLINVHGLLHPVHFILKDCFGKLADPVIKGVLSVEHCGIPSREHDGLCITTLVFINDRNHMKTETCSKPEYVWESLHDSALLKDLSSKLEDHKICSLL